LPTRATGREHAGSSGEEVPGGSARVSSGGVPGVGDDWVVHGEAPGGRDVG